MKCHELYTKELESLTQLVDERHIPREEISASSTLTFSSHPQQHISHFILIRFTGNLESFGMVKSQKVTKIKC